jgi:hypothetical protein
MLTLWGPFVLILALGIYVWRRADRPQQPSQAINSLGA